MKTGKSGYVYFIHAPSVALVKIGYTASWPESRFRAIRAGVPMLVKRLGFIRGTMDTERQMHAKFRALRSQGEWFSASPELFVFVEQNAIPWDKPPKKRREIFDQAARRQPTIAPDAPEWLQPFREPVVRKDDRSPEPPLQAGRPKRRRGTRLSEGQVRKLSDLVYYFLMDVLNLSSTDAERILARRLAHAQRCSRLNEVHATGKYSETRDFIAMAARVLGDTDCRNR